MGQPVSEYGVPVRLTASGLLKNGSGSLLGVFVASGTTPTIAIYEGTVTGGTILVNTFVPNTGVFTPIPFSFSTGCFATLGGTIDATFAVI